MTRRRWIARTPFLEGDVVGAAIAGATKGLAGSTSGCLTEVSAGEVERKSSSAPGRLALRVIVLLLGQLIHELIVDKTLLHLMKKRMK